MNGLMNWIAQQPQVEQFLPVNLSRVINPDSGPIPDFWKSPLKGKVLIRKLPTEFSTEQTPPLDSVTILGGMCLLNTVEMKRIYNREITFSSEVEFEKWFASWYPRIDQIHDTVGIPPGSCKKIIYVSEDSYFASRLSAYTGLNKDKIQNVLQKVHEQQGHAVLLRYLKAFGYKGGLSVVYTSDIENEMEVALRMWERILGQVFRKCDRQFAKVELMYTGFWLDILGVEKSAIIYESAGKMILKGYLKLDQWFKQQTFGSCLNQNLGIIGYVPFLTTSGDSSLLAYDKVPNNQNHDTFVITESDIPWYITNLLFTKKIVIENGPLSLSGITASEMIRNDLTQYYI